LIINTKKVYVLILFVVLLAIMGFYPTKYALTLFPLINFIFICYVFKSEIISYDYNKLINNGITYTHTINYKRKPYSFTLDTYHLIYWTFASASILQAIANLLVKFTLHLHAPDISFAYGYVAAPAISIIFSSCNEEIIYRKLLFGYIDKKYGFWIGSIVSSLIFAFSHYNYSAWLGYLTVGLIWCFIYKKINNLGIIIIAHVIMNLSYFVFFTIK
jgi:membrane protease YdiL (CAAX protease family)